MADNFSWSTSAGRWMGIPVRVHLFLYLMLIAVFAADWNFGSSNTNFFVGTAMVTALIIVASVLIHELAHVFAINSLGGHVNELLLMPWGGNSDFVVADNGFQRALVYLAGPFANAILFGCGTAMLVQAQGASFLQLINPLEPHWFDHLDWQASLIKIGVWVNFQLFIVNLLPCFPFDAAQVVRALISTINVELPKYRVETAIKVIGHAVAFGFIGLAWLFRDVTTGPIRPMWMLLLALGVTLWFAARYSLALETQPDADSWDDLVRDFDSESALSEFPAASFFGYQGEEENLAYSQWLNEKRESRLEDETMHELLDEEAEAERADEILAKLHGDGIASLTEEEQQLLQRVSERIRRRREHSQF